MRAANLAGKAINVTTTTAPHALSYKLSSLYHIPHGHAVALTMAACWKLLLKQGDEATQERLAEIAQLMTARADAEARDGLEAFEELLASLDLPTTPHPTETELQQLVTSVNVQRLANFPLTLSPETIRGIYQQLA
jgi:alcohol dehydrogenase class IV